MRDDFQLEPEFQSIQALRPFSENNAPSREVMFGSHFSQRPVIEGSEPPIVLTGVEEEMGKYTFSIKMPEDATIVMKLPKYSPGMDGNDIKFNPETLVIYRSHDTGEFGCLTVPYYASHDPVFGFKYDIKEAFHNISPGSDVPGGTILADSPAVKGESHYTYSKNLNMCYMSHPNVGLDGYVISEDVLDHFKFRLYEKRVIEFGANEFPLNLYGDDKHYKAFPDLGEEVEESGLLAMLRQYDSLMAPALISRSDTKRRDYDFDRPIFARTGKGRVVDITVVQSMNSNRALPDEMVAQIHKYHIGCQFFYREIVRFYEQQMYEARRRGQSTAKFSRELHNLIVYAMAIVKQKGENGPNLTLTYKKKPLDVWRIEIVVEYLIKPNRGYKLTCLWGGGLSIT